MKLTRRGFLKFAGAAVLGGAAGVGYVTQVEPEWLTVEQQTVVLSRLPAGMDGYTIGVCCSTRANCFWQVSMTYGAVSRTLKRR